MSHLILYKYTHPRAYICVRMYMGSPMCAHDHIERIPLLYRTHALIPLSLQSTISRNDSTVYAFNIRFTRRPPAASKQLTKRQEWVVRALGFFKAQMKKSSSDFLAEVCMRNINQTFIYRTYTIIQ